MFSKTTPLTFEAIFTFKVKSEVSPSTDVFSSFRIFNREGLLLVITQKRRLAGVVYVGLKDIRFGIGLVKACK